mmetsp:Transcript_66353/g.128306  ORF Transcript_66353/g.128306 Transcript_66353/m.128306 type:complete len:427 (-) Transcript_66353:145-1425(-)
MPWSDHFDCGSWRFRNGALAVGGDLKAGWLSWAEARAVCERNTAIHGFMWMDGFELEGRVFIVFKGKDHPSSDNPGWSSVIFHGDRNIDLPVPLPGWFNNFSRDGWQYKRGALVAGKDIKEGWCSLAGAYDVCKAVPAIHGFTWVGEPNAQGQVYIYFKGKDHPHNDDPTWNSVILHRVPTVTKLQCDSADSQQCDLYSVRGAACVRGVVISICSYPCVEERAVSEVVRVVESMLSSVHGDVLARMHQCGCTVGIIGRCQKTSDMPPHSYLKGYKTSDGRCFDQGTRGLGGTKAIPVTTVGEENVMMERDAYFPFESILVHEFGHMVMNCGFDWKQEKRIHSIYQDASKNYSASLYMFSNAEELWANGTQAWFHAINRVDVNAGIKTRYDLQAQLPALADLMGEVYGNGQWRYEEDMPGTWAGRRR